MTRQARSRAFLLCAVAALAFTGFSYRLIHLQVVKHDEFAAMAAEKHTLKQTIHARRGLIFDRHGELLASNLPVRTITADGTHIKKPRQIAEVAAGPLEMSVDELEKKLSTDRKYIVLRRGMPEEAARALLTDLQSKGLRGLYSEPDAVRTYPNGQMLGHVLGFLDHEGTGIQGVESAMESRLRGRDGYRYIERDRTGREIMLYRGQEQPAEDGLNVRLTIDMGLQAIVEEEIESAYNDLKPTSAVAVMLDPHTGEILALANRPTFDPNDQGASPEDHKRNRAVTDMVEPGSTFKIVVAAGALNEGKVDERSMIFCENGRFHYGGRILRDHHGYGSMNVHDILVKSSNIGSAKMALMMGEDSFYEYVRRFGFGERTGIELPGEIPGLVHPPHRWDNLTITRMPMGHALAVTPLQIAVGMSVIASGGKLMAPTILKAVETSEGEVIEENRPRLVREVVPAATARFVSEALAEVVGERGTARLATVSGFSVAGKTGTAQKVSPTGGYAPGEYVVSFAGYLPAEDPSFVCLVIIDDAKVASGLNYGGTVAAPIFSRIAERAARYLDLVPALRAEAAEPLALGQQPEERAN